MNNLKKQIAEIASKLINFKTVNGDLDEVTKLYDYVSSLFKSKDNKIKIITDYENPILIIEPKKVLPEVYFCCHIDVVDGKENQFKPFVKGSKIFGRGSYDMKTETAACIALLLNNKLNAGLILTSDEEAAKSYNGATYIADLIKGHAKLVIVPDGEAQFAITNRVKGMADYLFISKGKSSRYSYPWRGVNPYQNLMKLYINLDEVFPEAKKASDKNIWYTTYNLLSIDAVDGSQVPEVGNMHVLVNLTTEYTKKSLYRKLKLYAKKYNCEVKEVFFGAPYEVSKNDPKLQKFKTLLDKFSGKKTKLLTMGAISDVRHFSEKGINTILCRIDGKGAHSELEYADLNSAVILYKALKEFISNQF